jgi:hypothetical protein
MNTIPEGLVQKEGRKTRSEEDGKKDGKKGRKEKKNAQMTFITLPPTSQSTPPPSKTPIYTPQK